MDELTISGKKYISSKRAHETTGYAKDYIGQLARAGKIPATRVGRSWYVDEGALLSYGDVAVVASEEEVTPTPAKGTLASQSILESRNVSKRLPTITHALLTQNKNILNTWGQVTYANEASTFVPQLREDFKKTDAGTISMRVEISDKREKEDNKAESVQQKEVVESSKVIKNDPMLSIRSAGVISAHRPQKQLVSKRSPLKRSKINSNYTLAFVSFAVIAFAISSGAIVSNHLSYAPTTGVYTANAYIGYENIKDILSHSPFIQNGINALLSFTGFIHDSFLSMFSIGLEYLKSLFNLV
ncbi:hypothetical protein EPO56_02220 [Patescibacteria group bacterium]|nr:MAG: hypothetical protein EPO56_02220 [Patescibacteria group bacterium]